MLQFVVEMRWSRVDNIQEQRAEGINLFADSRPFPWTTPIAKEEDSWSHGP